MNGTGSGRLETVKWETMAYITSTSAVWRLGQNKSPPRVISIGGRFGFDDVERWPRRKLRSSIISPHR